MIFPGTEEVLVEQEKKFLPVMPMRCFCLSPSNPKHRAGSSQDSLILKEMSNWALAALWEERAPESKGFQICSLQMYPRPWETSSALCSSVSSSITKRCLSVDHVERGSQEAVNAWQHQHFGINAGGPPSPPRELRFRPGLCPAHTLWEHHLQPPSSPERGVWCLWITEAKSARMEEVTQHGGTGGPRARPPTPRTIRTVLCTQPSAFHPSISKPLPNCSSPGSWVMISINRRKLGPKPRGGNFP